MKTLLRSYEGVFDQEVNIHEKSIAYALNIDAEKVVSSLQELDAFHIVSYQQQKDTPQLFFIQNRVRADELVINMLQYNERKNLYRARIEALIRYINSTSCRSQFTGN